MSGIHTARTLSIRYKLLELSLIHISEDGQRFLLQGENILSVHHDRATCRAIQPAQHAVSYTHLDVYKRQLLVLALAGAFAHKQDLGVLHTLPEHDAAAGSVQRTALAGEDEDSWLSQFNASGKFDSVDTQIAGLGGIKAIQDLYCLLYTSFCIRTI